MIALLTNKFLWAFIIIVVGIVAIGLVTGGITYDTSTSDNDWSWNFTLTINGEKFRDLIEDRKSQREDRRNIPLFNSPQKQLPSGNDNWWDWGKKGSRI